MSGADAHECAGHHERNRGPRGVIDGRSHHHDTLSDGIVSAFDVDFDEAMTPLLIRNITRLPKGRARAKFLE